MTGWRPAAATQAQLAFDFDPLRMTRPHSIAFLVILAALLALGAFVLFSDGGPATGGTGTGEPEAAGAADPLRAAGANADVETRADGAGRSVAVDPLRAATGVRGRVVDVRTGNGVGGVEVLALRRPPSLERLFSRFRGLFRKGLWTEANSAPEVLGRALTGPDGSFEILGVPSGQLYVDGRSESVFVRTPAAVRIAAGEIVDGVEVLATGGGRLRGTVLGPEGRPMGGAVVNLRPGLNAFLGQMTQRKYRWLEVAADAEGRFDIPGVPTGAGYTVSATHAGMAIEEVHGVDVTEGRTTNVTIRGHDGAVVMGRVIDRTGAPAVGVNVAMVYLDISRVLFSADGRDEPLQTGPDGAFRFDRIAAGRVAFVAAGPRAAPSQIEEMTVVDGGIYEDLTLQLGEGRTFVGRVVDESDQPLQRVAIEARPMERPNDPDVLKMALKIRTLRAQTGPDGVFQLEGLTGSRLMLKGEKAGYCSELRFGVKLDDKDVVLELVRGATIRGRVVDEDGKPVRRFRVDTRSRDIPAAEAPKPETDAAKAGASPKSAVVANATTGATSNDDDSGRGGFGRRGRGSWGRSGSMRVPEGTSLSDRGLNGSWRDLKDGAGKFVLTGIPPGRVRVRVEATGCLRVEQNVDLRAGESSDELVFTLKNGVSVAGRVIDESGAPVPDAQVSANRGEPRSRGRGPFRINFEREDFDFLGLMARNSKSGAMTDSKGRFVLRGLTAGQYRFSARHPDMAKASVKDVEIGAEAPPREIVIQLTPGGNIEGFVTGAGRQPLRDALMVALSLSAGAFKSSSTDARGYYKIHGLPPGAYIVFKSRMDERAINLGYDLLGNMRLKTVTVRAGKTSKLDVHDAAEGTVRVFGRVTDGGKPVKRAMVSALSSDSEGILGMGIRAKPTDERGMYELVGLKPGDFVFQVTRFQGRPQQAGLGIEIPEDVSEFRVDLQIPQSYISGRVIDAAGNGVPGIRVQAGVTKGGVSRAPGLLGLIVKNGIAQARTDDTGAFKLVSISQGTYRVTASGRGGRRGGDDAAAVRYGDVSVSDILIDGSTPRENVVLILPRAGTLVGQVVDGSGAPLAGAEISYRRDDAPSRSSSRDLQDLFGMQMRPAKSGADGRFEIKGVTPGTYTVSADAKGLAPGKQDDVIVQEGQPTAVVLRAVRGATLRARARNIDGTKIPFARITLLDGKGKAVVKSMSVMSIFRRAMGGKTKKDDSGWYEFGNVPPDTYTIVITEKAKPDVRVTRTIKDGETAEWDIDLTAELEARGRVRGNDGE